MKKKHSCRTRIVLKTVGIFLLLLLFALPAAAETETQTVDELYQQQLEASGADDLLDKLPDETKALMDKLGITGLDADGFSALEPNSIVNNLLNLLSQESSGPLQTAGILLGIILLCALMESIKQTVKEPAMSEVFGVVCALGACTAVLIPVSACIQRICEAAESTSIFMISFVPVYAGVVLATGQIATAASYQTVVLFVAELISLMATYLIVPVMTISLALSLTGSVTTGMKLDAVGGLINKASGWLLGLTTTLFVGLLSLQGIVGAAADSLSGRAIKLSLSSFVPVVGSALGEAVNTVRGCLTLLKSTIGGFGILATALIVLPPLLECAMWMACLSVCNLAAEMFELGQISTLLKAVQSVVKTLIGVLAACSLFMIIATTIVTVAGSAT